MQQLQKDLEKVSSQRENAAKDGLIRPFLYLVSLSPVARLQVAINLGFVLMQVQFFPIRNEVSSAPGGLLLEIAPWVIRTQNLGTYFHGKDWVCGTG
jgi:hypothetical protein